MGIKNEGEIYEGYWIELWVPTRAVDELVQIPSALEFYREYVARNVPVLLKGACSNWSAMKLWSDRTYLEQTMKSRQVTVALTPTGRADSVQGRHFVKPLEQKMEFSSFLEMLDNPQSDVVPYLQLQNDSMNREFGPLCGDVEEFQFAKEAFAAPSDACNFWMGESRTMSSLHKDPFENIYCVVQGTKRFSLLPPTDYWFLYEREYISATYTKDERWDIVEDQPETKVTWSPLDLNHLDIEKFPETRHLRPLQVDVEPGDVLYLPSFWFHQVEQCGPCTIAVNWWYDMKFSAQYTWYRFQEQLYHQLLRRS